MLHTLLQIRILLAIVPMLGAVLWLGAGGGETYYERPPSEVKAAIAQADLPLHILGQHVRGSRVSNPDDQTVVTALLDKDGTELMRFVTTVTPDGSGSSVETEVRGPEGRHAKGAAEAMKTQAFTMSLMEKLAVEHVAAAIEGRPFDMLAFNPMAKQLAVATGHDKMFNDANEAAMESAKSLQEMEESEDGFSDDSWVEPSSAAPVTEYESGDDWGSAATEATEDY